MGIFGRKDRPSRARQSKDPVCGMLVVETLAVGPETVGATTYYFCSTACHETFKEKGKAGRTGQEREMQA